MFWRLTLSMLMAILFVDNVAAQVQINRVDRSFQTGISVIIEGSGFGAKGTSSPKMWDDLTDSSYDGLSDGDVFPTREGTYGHPQDSNAPQDRADYPSTQNPSVLEMYNARVPGRPVYSFKNYKGSAILELGDVGGDFLVADWWIYSSDIASGNFHEIKLGRFWAGHDGTAGRVTIYPDHIQYDTTSGTSNDYGFWIADGAWNHYRLTIDSSGGLGAGNGVVKFYWNGALVGNFSDLSWDEGVSSGPNYTWAEMIGAVDYNQQSPHIGTTFVGDIYLDNTSAMVAIADSPTWSEVQHYELQIPEDWQSQAIQVTANLGSFAMGESVWLYVINSDGTVNQDGFPVETNIGPPPEGPGQPGQPIHNES